jgi:hypothetical protein
MKDSLNTAFMPWALAVSIFAVQCADRDGRDPYAMFDTFTHQGGKYSFRYLAPPWELENNDEEPNLQIIAIEADSKNMDASIESGPIHARFKGVISLRPNTSAEQAAEDDAASISDIDASEVEVSSFTSEEGNFGFYLRAALPDRNIRSVYFDTTENDAAVMQVVSRESIEAADFTLLLRSLEPNGDRE